MDRRQHTPPDKLNPTYLGEGNIDSLEPRWFYGVKSFSETSIGAVPGALSNAICNACGVRIREHPITREKIIAGLSSKRVAPRRPA